ncbi:MAG: T9SS type A sorting domain-containing protein [Ignavibacteria bacterium]|nr:T9SS type A sorting domain-containing protein [Ignavibacteria bacterium]
MKKIIFLLAVFSAFSLQQIKAQTGWITLSSPTANSFRFDDVHFPNASTGFVVVWAGKVFKTTDGGNFWTQITSIPNGAYRSVGFFDANTGVIGTLTAGNPLYRTTNGGATWNPITSFGGNGSVPQGICGLCIQSQTHAFGVGRYYQPAQFIKTSNGGENWTSIRIDTSLATSLVDCYFWSQDSGVVIGGKSPTSSYAQSYAVVLLTTNGGENFSKVFTSAQNQEWGWKVIFINKLTGFVSVESTNRASFLKTTNGGYNWCEIQIPITKNIQGIGFINENTGWIGGFDTYSYQTTNGGANWQQITWGKSHNRFRFINDTLAFSAGYNVYKYSGRVTGINPANILPDKYVLNQNFPNPFNPNTIISYEIPTRGLVQLKIYNVAGKETETCVNEIQSAGVHTINFKATHLPSGIYYYSLITEHFTETRKMALIK